MRVLNTLSVRRFFGLPKQIDESVRFTTEKVIDLIDLVREDEQGLVLTALNIKPTVPCLISLSPHLYSLGAVHAPVVDGSAPIRIFIPASTADQLEFDESYIEGFVL